MNLILNKGVTQGDGLLVILFNTGETSQAAITKRYTPCIYRRYWNRSFRRTLKDAMAKIRRIFGRVVTNKSHFGKNISCTVL